MTLSARPQPSCSTGTWANSKASTLRYRNAHQPTSYSAEVGAQDTRTIQTFHGRPSSTMSMVIALT